MSAARAPKVLESLDPATGESLGSVPVTSPRAVARIAGEVARVQAGWALVPVAERARILRHAAEVIRHRRSELSELVTRETGKTLMEAAIIEVDGLGLICEWLATWAPRYLAPERVPLSRVPVWQKRHRIEYPPLGVVGVIGPWNYPFTLAGSEVAFALAAGNGVVLKPSELTPFSGVAIAEVFAEAGVPRGLLRVAQGGGETGAAVCKAEAVRKVFFTGSTATGRTIQATAARHGKPVVLEMGGKDPAIVCADADLERTVAGLAWSSFANAGQTCASVERAYVDRSVHDELVAGMSELAKRLEPGDPRDVRTQVGAVTERQHERVVEHLEDAVSKGATVVCGGPVQVPGLAGRFIAPVVLTGVDHSMTVMREESFGPVLPIMAVGSEDEAVSLANDSPYGLGASVWSRDVRRARRLAARLDAGMVWVNDHAYSHPLAGAPWGGIKDSGSGVVHSKHGLYEMVDKRLVSEDAGRLPTGWWYPYDEVRMRGFSAMVDTMSARGVAPRARVLRERGGELVAYLRALLRQR